MKHINILALDEGSYSDLPEPVFNYIKKLEGELARNREELGRLKEVSQDRLNS